MKAQKKYWDNKIKEWSAVSYDKTLKASFIEILATPFRGADKRVATALSLVGPLVTGKTVLFLGCGVGNECFDILKYKPKKIIGIDISPVAIAVAKKKARLKKLKNLQFKTADIGTVRNLPRADYILGLGFIDYLTESELKKLFYMVTFRKYLFSFFEKKLSLFNLIHEIYVRSQKCPGAFKYSRQEIKSVMPKKSRHFFFEKNGMLFLTNTEKFRNAS